MAEQSSGKKNKTSSLSIFQNIEKDAVKKKKQEKEEEGQSFIEVRNDTRDNASGKRTYIKKSAIGVSFVPYLTTNEKKTRRLPLLIRPSIYEKLELKCASITNDSGKSISINEAVNQLIEEWLKNE